MICPVSINGVAIRPGCYVAGMLNDAVGNDGIVKEITLRDDGWTIVVYSLPSRLSVWYAKEHEVYCFTKRPSLVIAEAADKAKWGFDMDGDQLWRAVEAIAATGR